MGEMIQKPDTNPIIIALANSVVGALGYYLMGQERKAMFAAAITLVTFLITCSTLVWLPILVFMYDGYLLGQKLQSGQSIGQNENGLAFLDNIFKD